MCSFRSVLVISATTLVLGFFSLDFLKDCTRYEFLVKGDVCVAFDRREEALKFVDAHGCTTVPLRRTEEDLLRERTERIITRRVQEELRKQERNTSSSSDRASEEDEDEDEEEESSDA